MWMGRARVGMVLVMVLFCVLRGSCMLDMVVDAVFKK